MAQQELVI